MLFYLFSFIHLFSLLNPTLFTNEPKFNTGFALQNIGNKLKYISESYPLPKIVRLGGNYNFLIEKDFESQKTLSTFLDINYLQDTDFNLGGGIEMKIDYIKSSAFAIRTGYKTDNGDKRAGFSIGFGLDMRKYNIDYSYSFMGSLGKVHKISIIIRVH